MKKSDPKSRMKEHKDSEMQHLLAVCYMPSTILRDLCAVSHLKSKSPYATAAKIIPISRMKKPRHREITVNIKPQLVNKRVKTQIQYDLNPKSFVLPIILNLLGRIV